MRTLCVVHTCPAGVKLVLEAVCFLRGVQPMRRPADPRRNEPSLFCEFVDDYWPPSQKMMLEQGFLQSLM